MLFSKEINALKTPFDFAQGDCQTERSRSLLTGSEVWIQKLNDLDLHFLKNYFGIEIKIK
jgi:hypothetical protein